MDGFSLDTTIFTEQELAAIFTGLKSLDSVSNSAFAEKVAQKIGGSEAIRLADNMVIDLSSFYKDDLSTKIAKMKRAMKESKCITFHYCYYTEWGFTKTETAVEWFLSFGDKVKILNPPEMVQLMKNTLESIKNLYKS